MLRTLIILSLVLFINLIKIIEMKRDEKRLKCTSFPNIDSKIFNITKINLTIAIRFLDYLDYLKT